MTEITNINDLNKLRDMFVDIRFHMGLSVLDGKMGKAFVDDIDNINFAMLLVRKYCFISGIINIKELEKLVKEFELFEYKIIPSDEIKQLIEKRYLHEVEKSQRYSIKKNVKFDIYKLKDYEQNCDEKYEFKLINEEISNKIRNEKFINITDDYEKNGIGYCCIYNGEIIGVASSNIIYNDGIEVNIKVKEEHRKNHIATVLASKLILACLEENKTVSWDASNMISVRLAQKLGFEYDSTYDVYKFIK